MSRVVLVTGGSRGIGLACAQRFKDLGDHVAVTYNSSPPPDGLFGVKCDVTSAESVDAAFAAVEAEFGPVEVLVSNAGITNDGLLLRMSESDFTSVIDANLTAAYRVTKRAAQGMLRAKKGRIVLVSSVVGLSGQAGQANYAASKAGLVGFARSVARELGSRSITCNVVAPGPVATDMTAALGEPGWWRSSPPPTLRTSPVLSSPSMAAWAWVIDDPASNQPLSHQPLVEQDQGESPRGPGTFRPLPQVRRRGALGVRRSGRARCQVR